VSSGRCPLESNPEFSRFRVHAKTRVLVLE
jgi:hypothetical protein